MIQVLRLVVYHLIVHQGKYLFNYSLIIIIDTSDHQIVFIVLELAVEVQENNNGKCGI